MEFSSLSELRARVILVPGSVLDLLLRNRLSHDSPWYEVVSIVDLEPSFAMLHLPEDRLPISERLYPVNVFSNLETSPLTGSPTTCLL